MYICRLLFFLLTHILLFSIFSFFLFLFIFVYQTGGIWMWMLYRFCWITLWRNRCLFAESVHQQRHLCWFISRTWWQFIPMFMSLRYVQNIYNTPITLSSRGRGRKRGTEDDFARFCWVAVFHFIHFVINFVTILMKTMKQLTSRQENTKNKQIAMNLKCVHFVASSPSLCHCEAIIFRAQCFVSN